jgi:hypothetical protein
LESPGAHAASRFTARFSLAIFILAFAQPGLITWSARWPTYVALVRSFLAAHCVHFAAVTVMLVMDPYSMLRNSPLQAAPLISIGFLVVIVAGVTASAREQRYRILHSLTISLVFGIFLLDYASDPRAVAGMLPCYCLLRRQQGYWESHSETAKQASQLAADMCALERHLRSVLIRGSHQKQ